MCARSSRRKRVKRFEIGAEGGIRTHERLRDRLLKQPRRLCSDSTPLAMLGYLCAETQLLLTQITLADKYITANIVLFSYHLTVIR